MSDSWDKIFTRLFSEVIEAIENHMEEEVRKDFYLDLIEVYEDYNEDVLKDLMGLSISFDEALLEIRPELFEEHIEDIEK